ncbi:MAG: YciI family protein [Dehalococcoidia bacterium]|jgi:hypothetical protein|nr:YciI family protein [Dehalococcoidia bacterium]
MSTNQPEHTHYIYQFEIAVPLEDWTEREYDIARQHRQYLEAAHESGRILLAGRSTDGIGPAIVVFEAKSPEAAEEFLQNDPFIENDLMRATVHPFRATLTRE